MYLPWTENGAGGKVDLMIASGQEFDACIVDPTWAASSYSKGYLQDLSDVIDKISARLAREYECYCIRRLPL